MFRLFRRIVATAAIAFSGYVVPIPPPSPTRERFIAANWEGAY